MPKRTLALSYPSSSLIPGSDQDLTLEFQMLEMRNPPGVQLGLA